MRQPFASPEAAGLSSPPSSQAATDWPNHGSELRALKLRLNEANPTGIGGGEIPGNAGDWAYQSDPVSLGKAGTYELVFKVDDSFNCPSDPSTFVLANPPGLEEVTYQGAERTYEADGSKYFSFRVVVPSSVVPYESYTAWIY